MFALHILLVSGFRQLTINRPYLPGYAFRLEGPPSAALLEELETDRAARGRGRSIDRSEKIRKIRYLPFHCPPQSVRLTADVSEINKIAVDVNVAHGSYRVALLAVVREFSAGSMEENSVEYAGDDLVYLPTFHGQFERDSPCVHDAVSGPTLPPTLST